MMMPTTTSSVTRPTIKANDPPRRSSRRHDKDNDDGAPSSSSASDRVDICKKSRRPNGRGRRACGNNPDDCARKQQHRRRAVPRDDSTATTEPSSSSDECPSLDSVPSPDDGARRSRRRRSRKTSNRRTPGAMVVSVPSSQSSSSSYDVDEHDVGDVDIVDKSRYLAIDCEMVGIGPCGRTSRLARVAVLNYDGDVVYDVHVQVAERVTDHRTYVSGILPEDLLEDNGAVPFDEARHAVLSMMRGKVIVGHGLKNDLMALGIWDHPWHDVRDTARYVPFMRRTHHDEYNPTNATHLPKKLKTLARDKLNMEIQAEDAPHSPIEDALAALLLYRRHRTKWESAIRYKVERTREISCQGSLNETI